MRIPAIHQNPRHRKRGPAAGATAAIALLAAIALAADHAMAQPPPWAPAHGYRAKQGLTHVAPPQVHVVPPTFSVDRCVVSGSSVGGLVGGIAGGVLGSQIGRDSGRTAAAIGGTIIGVIVGSAVGEAMAPTDYYCTIYGLQAGEPVAWTNAETGYAFQLVPTGRYNDAEGRFCQDFATTAAIDGYTHQTYGTACLQPDGSWDVVN
jgi:surface antigen